MKKLNFYSHHLVTVTLAIVMLSACSKMEFGEIAPEQMKAEAPVIPLDPIDPVQPVDPVVPPPPQVSYGFKLSNGECAADSSTQLLTCSKCEVPKVTPVPQLSKKAQALLDVMHLACGIYNKSDQTNVRPTRDMILNKLNRASEQVYPETARTAEIEMMIQGLTNPNDDSLRKKMFKGLYYQPPYSNWFEVYFGLAVNEAKSTFCWYGDRMDGAISNKTGIYSIEWLNCQYDGSNPFNCKEKPEWILGQQYRKQLETALKLGVTDPYKSPTPEVQKRCFWEKFEGDDVIAAKIQLKKWKSEGRQVSMTVKKDGVGQCGVASESNIALGFRFEMATYKCE